MRLLGAVVADQLTMPRDQTMQVASRYLPFCLMGLWCVGSSQANARSAYSSEIGLKSEATIRIKASIAPRMQFSGTQKLQVQREKGSSRVIQRFCVWSTTPSRIYSIRTAASGQDAFSLVGKTGARLGYKIEWADSSEDSDRVVLSRETLLEGLIAASPTVPCGSLTANTPRLIIHVSESGDRNIQALNYAGTLLLIVAPQ